VHELIEEEKAEYRGIFRTSQSDLQLLDELAYNREEVGLSMQVNRLSLDLISPYLRSLAPALCRGGGAEIAGVDKYRGCCRDGLCRSEQ